MKVLSSLRHGYYARNELEVPAMDMQPGSVERYPGYGRLWRQVWHRNLNLKLRVFVDTQSY